VRLYSINTSHMLRLHDVSSEFGNNTMDYIELLDERSNRVVQLVDSLPVSDASRTQLRQTWDVTRQKLDFFRREMALADGELQRDLAVLHGALLPEVISYQVKMGEVIITNSCSDHRYLSQWREIWQNFELS